MRPMVTCAPGRARYPRTPHRGELACGVPAASAAAMPIVIRVHRTGGPECLVADDVDVPPPLRGDVQLVQTAVGVNFIDCHHRAGRYPLPGLPHGIGSEAAGIVAAVGDGVRGIAVGQRVAYAAGMPPGAYAQRRNVPAWRVVPVPDGVDDVTVAAVLLKGLTAELLVRRVFRVGPGHRVLVHAAAGGVGLLLCQWLRHLDATVIGAVSTAAKAELAHAYGCHHTIVGGPEELVPAVARLTKDKGVDVVYDSIGRTTLRASMRCLRTRGTLVSFGNASGAPEPVELAELQRASLFLTRPKLDDYTATAAELRRAAAALLALVQGGVLRAHVDSTLPLASAAAAHERLEARRSAGAIVLVP